MVMDIEKVLQERMQTVISAFGGPSRLSKKLGIKPQAVSQWDAIPELRAYEIERLSHGKFSIYFMRPDLFERRGNDHGPTHRASA